MIKSRTSANMFPKSRAKSRLPSARGEEETAEVEALGHKPCKIAWQQNLFWQRKRFLKTEEGLQSGPSPISKCSSRITKAPAAG